MNDCWVDSRNTDELCMLVKRLASLEQEGNYWDFKREWHRNNANLLHDIVCLANNANGSTAYLIIGIDEESGFRPYDIAEHSENRKNTQQVISVLRSAHWADAHPSVQVKSLSIDKCAIDVIVIVSDREAIPYYLTQDKRCGGVTVRAGAIYVRTADSNTPLDGTASTLDTIRLWQRRFGIDRTPKERLSILLRDHDSWSETQDTLEHEPEAFTEAYYHSQYPEFVFVKQPDGRRDAWEYFMLNIPFFTEPNWYVVRFFYHQTMLYECLGMYLDHHFVGVPKPGSLQRPETYGFDNRVIYRYYIADSIEEQIGRFSLQKEGRDSEVANKCLLEVVPVFRSERERCAFEEYVLNDWDLLESVKNGSYRSFFKPQLTDPRYRNDFADILESEAKYGAALVDLLQMYRDGK